MRIAGRTFLIVAAVGLALAGWGAPSRAAYYDGKTITVLIGYGAGSGVTLAARNFAPYWEKYIPGNPTIVVKNMPGGGALKAQNFLYEKARPDGRTLYWGPIAIIGKLMGSPGVRAEYHKLEFIGASGRTLVTYVGKRPGLAKPSDITRVKETLVIACTRPTSNLCLLHRLGFEILGVPHRIVAGFRSTPKSMRAIMQGEVHTHTTPDHTYRAVVEPNLVKTGKGIGLYYYPQFDAAGMALKNPSLPELESLTDVYRAAHGGTSPSGPAWQATKWITGYFSKLVLGAYAPPGTPQEAVADLRKGYYAVSRDKAYLDQYEKEFGVPVHFTGAEEGAAYLQSVVDADPEMVRFLKEFDAKVRKPGKRR